MPSVRVPLGRRSYSVHVGRGLLARAPELLAGLRGRRLALVSNPRVQALHGHAAERALARLGPVTRLLVPDGERFKTLGTWRRLLDRMLAEGLGRDAVLVALGGGVVGDLAGFAAAAYMRGIDLVQVPTTLLAMVDSSVGGKVGVNLPAGKNMVGAFHQPLAVLADTALLDTLAPREAQGGAYEMLKCGLIGDRALFESVRRHGGRLEDWSSGALEQAVAAAVALKARVVSRDEREGGLRRVLNLGHTLGHAFEAVTAYRRFTHGEAVGWGLLGAARLAAGRGLIDEGTRELIAHAVERLGPRPPVRDLEPAAVLAALARDKKARAGRVPFVLPTALGRVEVVEGVTRAELRRVLRTLAAPDRTGA